MGWLRKNLKSAGKKLKKFFKTDVGKVIGTVALAVAGFYLFGPAAVAGGVPTVTATGVPLATGAAATGTGVVTATSVGTGTAAGAGTAAATGIPTVTATSVPLAGAATASKVPTAVKVATATPGAATIDALTKGAGDTLTKGSGVADVGNIAGISGNVAGTAGSGTEQLASTIIDDASANVANGNHMISNNLTDATTNVLDFYQGPNNQGAKNLFKKQTALAEEYGKRSLTNLAEQPISDAAQTKLLFEAPSTKTAGSLLNKPSFETSLINNDVTSSMQFDKDLMAPKFSDTNIKGPWIGKRLKDKAGELLTSEYAKGTAQGVTASVLTSAILGPGGEQDGGGGQVQPYDKDIGNARNYVSDISQSYQQNTGQPLTFNMFTQNSTPLYGPSSPQNLVRNPFLT